MKIHAWALLLLTMCAVPQDSEAFGVIRTREGLKYCCKKPQLVMVASTGRSGSTMITQQLDQYLGHGRVLKTHILPPDRSCFKGKILFIFSNPDKAAESVLYQILHQERFWEEHFVHIETADRKWQKKIGLPQNQTEENNLLSYDALGIYEHLKVWLHAKTSPTTAEKGQILAIKYENLWEKETIIAIRDFLNIPNFKIPKWEERGHTDLFPDEIAFKQRHNLGTEEDPRYPAYDEARKLWEEAPPFQYLNIR